MEDLIIPSHVGFIMDGNGRWAKQRNKSRNYGHVKGSETARKTITACYKKGIKTVSLYALSTENLQRPKKEIDKLISLLKSYLENNVNELTDNKIKLIVSGDVKGLSEELYDKVKEVEKLTSVYTERTLNLTINYGGRQEILNAVNKVIKSGKKEVSASEFEKELDTGLLDDLDLIVRTSGEQRLSNFMLYKAAYAELYYTDVYWPDFNEEELDKAIIWYNGRTRRFGKVK